MEKIKNYTKWQVNFIAEDGSVLKTIDPSGHQLRAKEQHRLISNFCGIPLIQPVYLPELDSGEVPPKEEGIIYIVSPIALQAWPERDDFFIVHDPVKGNDSKIIGYRGLARLA
jgi:hypothetical protein